MRGRTAGGKQAGCTGCTGYTGCWRQLWHRAITLLKSPASDERENDKNGNMAFKVHKMAVIHALLLRGHNE